MLSTVATSESSERKAREKENFSDQVTSLWMLKVESSCQNGVTAGSLSLTSVASEYNFNLIY